MPKKSPQKPLKKTVRRRSNKRFGHLKQIVSSRRFGHFYVLSALLGLIVTTLFWSFLGAKLHNSNADQLINSYLFETGKNFHSSMLPSQHSFMLKWPLFWLIGAVGTDAPVFIAFTISICLVTVGVLASLIYRIEKRPLPYGTILMALSLVLLMTPAAPYAGALLPVNMAMIATRNLEYVLYIAALTQLIKSPKPKANRSTILALICLILLIASDKLFFMLTVGGAMISLVVYMLVKGKNLIDFSLNWLAVSFLGTAFGVFLVWLVNRLNILHIFGLDGAAPYNTVSSLKNVVLAVLYAFMGLLTNFGANPAYDATIVKNIPDALVTRTITPSGLAFILNALIFIVTMRACYWLVKTSIRHNAKKSVKFDKHSKLALALVYTSIASVALFVASDHYYAVDARYLTISLFAGFVTLAVYVRRQKVRPEYWVLTGVMLVFGMLLGSRSVTANYNNSKIVLGDFNERNALVASALDNHPVDILVGDYWRVVPTKLKARYKLNILPYSGCLEARPLLTSKQWQVDITKNSFAYLLSLDKGLTDYPACSLEAIVAAYGRPNSSLVISGSIKNPREILMFYDRGTNKQGAGNAKDIVSPSPIDAMQNVSCKTSTVLNIVAHEDDDLLFMNPDTARSVSEGKCVRTVYITAGDAGIDRFFWLSRELGSQAAYAKMLNGRNVWTQRAFSIEGNKFIEVASPRESPRITLIYMHLPDGNLRGEGFAGSGYQSLGSLNGGHIPQINSVDGHSSYSYDELVNALGKLMQLYKPAEVRTQASYRGAFYPDHNDHVSTGYLAEAAYNKFLGPDKAAIKFYIGYPTHELDNNISEADLRMKQDIFLEYAKYDPSVCSSSETCANTPTYGSYLRRQYTHQR